MSLRQEEKEAKETGHTCMWITMVMASAIVARTMKICFCLMFRPFATRPTTTGDTVNVIIVKNLEKKKVKKSKTGFLILNRTPSCAS
jgi:hypothetical protein